MNPRFAAVESTRLVHVSAQPPLFQHRRRLEELATGHSRALAEITADINSVQALIDLHYAVNDHGTPSRRR